MATTTLKSELQKAEDSLPNRAIPNITDFDLSVSDPSGDLRYPFSTALAEIKKKFSKEIKEQTLDPQKVVKYYETQRDTACTEAANDFVGYINANYGDWAKYAFYLNWANLFFLCMQKGRSVVSIKYYPDQTQYVLRALNLNLSNMDVITSDPDKLYSLKDLTYDIWKF